MDGKLPSKVRREAQRLVQEATAEWDAAKTDQERRAALSKNLTALLKIGQHILGERAAFLLLELDAALDDVENGKALPSWMKRPRSYKTGAKSVSTLQQVLRGAYAGCVDVLLQQGYREEDVMAMVSDVAGVKASQLRDFRKSIGDLGSEEAQTQRAATVKRFSKYDDPAKRVCDWLASGEVPRLRR